VVVETLTAATIPEVAVVFADFAVVVVVSFFLQVIVAAGDLSELFVHGQENSSAKLVQE
jgi:hypothetical protein